MALTVKILKEILKNAKDDRIVAITVGRGVIDSTFKVKCIDVDGEYDYLVFREEDADDYRCMNPNSCKQTEEEYALNFVEDALVRNKLHRQIFGEKLTKNELAHQYPIKVDEHMKKLLASALETRRHRMKRTRRDVNIYLED